MTTTAINYEEYFTDLSEAKWKQGNLLTSAGTVSSASCPWGRVIKAIRLDYARVRDYMHRGYDITEALPVIKGHIKDYTTFAEGATQDHKLAVISLVNDAIENVNELLDSYNSKKDDGAKLEKLTSIEVPKQKPEEVKEPAPVPQENAPEAAAAKPGPRRSARLEARGPK